MNKFLHPRYRNYIFLVPLFAAVIFYELMYVGVGIQVFVHGRQMVGEPFEMTAEGMVKDVDDSAKRSGLGKGDRIISIGGQTITSDIQLAGMLRSHRPGDAMPVMVMPKNGSAPRMDMVPVPPMLTEKAAKLGNVLLSALIVLMSVFCAVVGIYVAAIRPYDVRALILFGLLLGVSQVARTFDSFAFPPSVLMFVVVYRTVVSATWPIWMFLFGLYFPHDFSWDRSRPWLKYLLLTPLAVLATLYAIQNGLEIVSFRSASPLDRLLDTKALDFIEYAFSVIAVSSFFAFIGFKFGKSTKDARRRLRILLAGSMVSLTPLFLFVLVQLALRDSGRSLPEWAIVVAVLLFCIFPLTLAYVIVVERAMDLKMVIRQGVRYGLARTGVRVALYVIIGGTITGANVSLNDSKLPPWGQITIIVATIVLAIVFVRIVRKRAFNWLDRKFFREAYNADQILEELSDSVRTIVEEDVLLDTVTKSISTSLHVSNIAFLVNGDGVYRPIHCHGIALRAPVQLAENGATVEYVRSAKEPPRIYHDDRRNWVHDAPESEVEALRELQSQLLLPVGLKNKLLGILSLGPKRSDEPYSRSDVQLLKSVALQTGLALENSRLTTAIATEMAKRETLSREIEIAREVQERLFPQKMEPIAGLDYFGACRPALAVGGDYYDFLKLANGNFGIAIGDVSGKGIAAALLMASLQASLRGQAMLGQADLARVMCNINQLVFDATPNNRYATFFYGEFNRESRVFTYVNGGHNPPIILRRVVADSEFHVIRLTTGGPVVGLFRNAPYQQASLILEPGDLFLGFTDGISEAMNMAEEEWGEDRMIPALCSCASSTAMEIVPQMMRLADCFVSGAPQHDDMTMVVMKLLAA